MNWNFLDVWNFCRKLQGSPFDLVVPCPKENSKWLSANALYRSGYSPVAPSTPFDFRCFANTSVVPPSPFEAISINSWKSWNYVMHQCKFLQLCAQIDQLEEGKCNTNRILNKKAFQSQANLPSLLSRSYWDLQRFFRHQWHHQQTEMSRPRSPEGYGDIKAHIFNIF